MIAAFRQLKFFLKSLITKEIETSLPDLVIITVLVPAEYYKVLKHIVGLVQDCSISIALAMEILQSCTFSH